MSFVQQKLGADAGVGGTSPTVTFTSTVGVGNTVVALVVFDQSDGATGDTVTLTDDKSNTYTQLDFVDDPNITQHFQCATFVALRVTNSPQTLTATITSSNPGVVEFAQIQAAEYSNVKAVDQHKGQNQRAPGTGTDAITSGTVTTTTVGNTLVGFQANTVAGTAVAAGTSYTSRAHDTGGLDWEISLEDRLAGATGSVAATFTDATNGGGATNDYTTFIIALSPTIPVVSDEPRGGPIRRKRQSPLKQQDDWIQKQTLFQTTTPPIGFDEDRGARSRRPPFRAHTTPLEDTWIQKQTLFQTTTPPIGFDEDRGQQARRVPWRAHPQPDYPEQQAVTQFQTFTPPIGFDEDRGHQVRRVFWRAHPDVLIPSDFLPPTVFVPLGFDEDRGQQARRIAWRQHTQAITDDWILPPTTFVPLGFDEDRGRLIRRPWLAHPQPQDDWLQSQVTAPPIEAWGFDEEQHFQIRRPSWRQRQAGVDDFIQAPTVFVTLGFDEDRGRQIRRPWVAHPQPQDDWLLPLPVAFWGFDEEQHAQIRRPFWRARPELRDDDWIFSVIPQVTFVSWGFDEEQHAQIRRTSWRQMSAIRREEAGDFTPMPPPPPKAHATGNVIFGVIRNLF